MRKLLKLADTVGGARLKRISFLRPLAFALVLRKARNEVIGRGATCYLIGRQNTNFGFLYLGESAFSTGELLLAFVERSLRLRRRHEVGKVLRASIKALLRRKKLGNTVTGGIPKSFAAGKTRSRRFQFFFFLAFPCLRP